jgi:hypothetical protein
VDAVRVDIDEVMLRNLFNHLELERIAAAKSYQAYHLSWSRYLGSRYPHGTISAVLRLVAPFEEVVFDVHAFISPDCRIQESGLLDPKTLILQRRGHFIPIPVEK